MKHPPNFQFNLLTEPWIPVIYRDGTCCRAGILKALSDAHRIWRIDTGNPLDTFAIMRLLLAVLHWCRGNPPERLSPDPDIPFPEDWFTKARDHAKCFELFTEDGPRFYQDPAVRNAKNRHPVTNLIHEIPSGNNYPHFLHVSDEEQQLSPAACAIGLVRLPVFTTIGGPGKSYGINKTPPVYLMPESSSLAATLRLSWAVLKNRQAGIPAWEKTLEPLDGEVPLLTGLTWLPRRVWLDVESFDGQERCVFTGDPLRVGVRTMAFEGRAKQDVGEYTWNDPHAPEKLQSIDLFKLSKYPDAVARQWQENLLKIRELTARIEPWQDHPHWLIIDFNTNQAKFQDVRAMRVHLAEPDRIPAEPESDSPSAPLHDQIKQWGETRRKHLFAFQCHVIAAQARGEEASKKRTAGIKKSGLARFVLTQVAYPAEVGRLTDWHELLRQTPDQVYRAGERSMAQVFFPAVSVRDIIGQRRLQSRPFLPLKEYNQPAAKAVCEFVGRLLERKEGMLSLLRDDAGIGIHQDVTAFDLFTGLWWPVRQRDSRAPRRHIAWLVCKLYGWAPLPQRSGNALPKMLARAAIRLKTENPKHGNEIQESIIDRFDLLLNTPTERLDPELQWALSTVSDVLGSPGMDWEKLIDHLSVWHRHSLRLFWAQQFADTLAGPARDAEPAEENTTTLEETGS